MRILTRIIAMVGLVAAAGLDSERWVLCLAVAMGSGIWCAVYGYITSRWES